MILILKIEQKKATFTWRLFKKKVLKKIIDFEDKKMFLLSSLSLTCRK